jgi:hypothetical protein
MNSLGTKLPAVFRVLAVGIAASLGLVGILGREPRVWSPWPMVQFSLLTAGAPYWSGPLLAVALFFGLAAIAGLRRRAAKPMLGVALGLLAILSIAYALLRFQEGRSHQGLFHTVTVNAVSLLGLAFLSWRCHKLDERPSRDGVMTLVMFLLMWLFWLGFPYLGEGI